jgi:hypothetical protein
LVQGNDDDVAVCHLGHLPRQEGATPIVVSTKISSCVRCGLRKSNDLVYAILRTNLSSFLVGPLALKKENHLPVMPVDVSEASVVDLGADSLGEAWELEV